MVVFTDKSREELIEIGGKQADRIAQLERENAWFKEQFRLSQQRQFGSSSEATSVELPSLFNEAEVQADIPATEAELEKVSFTRRKTRGARELSLEDMYAENVERIEYRLPEDQQICPQCSGPLHEMGAEVRCEISMIPAHASGVKHVRYKYACRHCQREETQTPILTAPAPIPAFPGSLASPSAVAHIMTQKFVMSTPLYRQEQQFDRQGISISRQTMANWMIKGADWLDIVYARMHQHLLSLDVLCADETTLQVLHEAGRAAQTKSFMWLYRTGRDGPAVVLYEYQQTRNHEHPKRFLDGFLGYLQADGYYGYDPLAKLPLQAGGALLPAKVILVGCWAHARRGFDEAITALPSPARKSGSTAAHVGLAYCNKLFEIERQLESATTQQRYTTRLERSKPVLDAFKTWLDGQAAGVLPKSKIGEAIGYCRSQWTKLTAFLLDGRLEISNNRSERSIKPFVIGRKNWLFANTPRGARASAVIYSIVETAKENNLDPFAYLRYLFETLPNIDCNDPNAVNDILPWSDAVQTSCRNRSRATAQNTS